MGVVGGSGGLSTCDVRQMPLHRKKPRQPTRIEKTTKSWRTTAAPCQRHPVPRLVLGCGGRAYRNQPLDAVPVPDEVGWQLIVPNNPEVEAPHLQSAPSLVGVNNARQLPCSRLALLLVDGCRVVGVMVESWRAIARGSGPRTWGGVLEKDLGADKEDDADGQDDDEEREDEGRVGEQIQPLEAQGARLRSNHALSSSSSRIMVVDISPSPDSKSLGVRKRPPRTRDTKHRFWNESESQAQTSPFWFGAYAP